MLNIGPQELLLILVIALIVVGPTRLPELGRSIGKGLRELRKAQDEVKRTIQVNLDEPAAPTKAREPAPPRSAAAAETPTLAETQTAQADVPTAEVAAAGPDPVPQAKQPVPASDVLEISRTLGRSLAEIRRAKEEVQRGFRVEIEDPQPVPLRPATGAGEGPGAAAPAEPAGETTADEAPTG